MLAPRLGTTLPSDRRAVQRPEIAVCRVRINRFAPAVVIFPVQMSKNPKSQHALYPASSRADGVNCYYSRPVDKCNGETSLAAASRRQSQVAAPERGLEESDEACQGTLLGMHLSGLSAGRHLVCWRW